MGPFYYLVCLDYSWHNNGDNRSINGTPIDFSPAETSCWSTCC